MELLHSLRSSRAWAAALTLVTCCVVTSLPACSSGPSEGDPQGGDGGVEPSCPNGSCGPEDDAASNPDAPEPPPDCGATLGTLCAAGKKCKSSDDCVSTCVSGICKEPSVDDGKKNNDETDIDCGGATAPKCKVTKICLVDTDCNLGWCKTGTCTKPLPTDKIQNGTETDVDCGGAAQTEDGIAVPAAPRCALTKTCAADTDCASSVCANNEICIEAPSCRPIHGGQTCGKGEFGAAGADHESCCRSLPVPGLTMVQGGVTKNVYLDKYEITAGRVRTWIAAIKDQYAGVPNVKAWIQARIATDPILAAMLPAASQNLLPSQAKGQLATFPHKDGGTVELDIGLDDQLGPTSYFRGIQNSGSSGCYMGPDAYGHRTYWYDKTLTDYYGELERPAAQQDWLDEKSMNCLAPIMFAAFCAWDGGYLQSREAMVAAYGTKAWPWGDTPTPADNVAKRANYNNGTGNFNATNAPRYLYPIVNYATFANDFTPIIAAPGRFPLDIASQVRPGAESWMDLGGNMIEWSWSGGTYWGWTGSSFEVHLYGRQWNNAINVLDKYGKGSTRCMRLK